MRIEYKEYCKNKLIDVAKEMALAARTAPKGRGRDQLHIDNRIMFTAGKAALELGCFPGTVKVAYGIPLSATGKNPFFDRK